MVIREKCIFRVREIVVKVDGCISGIYYVYFVNGTPTEVMLKNLIKQTQHTQKTCNDLWNYVHSNNKQLENIEMMILGVI